MTGIRGLKRTPFTDAYPDGVTEWIDVFGYAVPVTRGDPGAETATIVPMPVCDPRRTRVRR